MACALCVVQVLTACATPTVWALDFGAMAGIGLLGVVASVLIVGLLVLVAACAGLELALTHTPPPPLELPLVGGGFPVAAGIFVLSLGGHAALPGVYASMAEPHKFDRMLDVSIATMCAIYLGGESHLSRSNPAQASLRPCLCRSSCAFDPSRGQWAAPAG